MSQPMPKRLYRVTWMAAVGWPEPERRQETARNYTTAETAGKQIAVIRAMPSHLELKSVHVSNDIEWALIEPDTLPVPETITDDEDPTT